MWFSIVATIVVVTGFFAFCAYLAKQFAFRNTTSEGDSLGNRLDGHGPHDEVSYRSTLDRLAETRANRRSESADDS